MEFLPLPRLMTKQRKGLHRQIEIALWLREFRYSSPAVIGKLIGVEGPYNGNLWHLMNNMKGRGLVQDFSNEIAPRLGRLFMAGPEMATFLELHGQEHARVVTNPVYVRRCKTAYHDLNIQLAVAHLREAGVDRVAKVESEIQMQAEDGGWLKPDVLLTNAAGKRVAMEYEMTRKANVRVYHTFAGHLHAIRSGLYSGVKYLFPNERLADTYRALFEASAWPNTLRANDGRVYVHGEAYDPDVIHGGGSAARKQYISFGVECYLQPV